MTEFVYQPECTALGCKNPPAKSSQLCAGCGDELGQWLARVDQLHDQLDAVPDMQAPAGGRVGGGGLASHRSPALLDVIVLRDRRSKERSIYDPDGNRGRGVLEVLAARADEVRTELGILVDAVPQTLPLGGRPIGPGICTDTWCDHAWCIRWTLRMWVIPQATIGSERKVLADNLPWILTQDWVDEFHAEMRALYEQLTDAPRIVAVRTRCRELIDGDQCTGAVRKAGPSSVRCDSCGTVTAGLDVVRRYGAVA